MSLGKRDGLYVYIEFKCENCNNKTDPSSSPRVPNSHRREVNVRLQVGGHLAGITQGGIAKLFGAINLPPSVKEEHFTATETYLAPSILKAQEQSMQKAVEITVSDAGEKGEFAYIDWRYKRYLCLWQTCRSNNIEEKKIIMLDFIHSNHRKKTMKNLQECILPVIDTRNRRLCETFANSSTSLPIVEQRGIVSNDYIDSEQASFEETAGIVSNTDNRHMICVTFRSLVLGLLFTILLSTLNQYFLFKSNSYSFPIILVLLISYPMGKFMAFSLRKKPIQIWRWSIELNPGQFSIKEHALIFIIAFVANLPTSALDTIVIKQIYYQSKTNFSLGLFLLISAQVMGYGMAVFWSGRAGPNSKFLSIPGFVIYMYPQY
ncbi:unnamed protein product [Didymodactylos carnosus]|uniref:Mutator-like transposase domain-containing protein n=1 Tax=Didymodactylos carnosus TaxID=1234261 RepID=A0A814QGP1_9BILA|nr:unnamed protein product [Didymodactylos carnosus]CAF3882073.1 unnamed protein product [Didymodactylos carnosus]